VKDWPLAVEGYAAAIDLLVRVAPRSLARNDQEYWLSTLAGLGGQAAACCLEADQVDRAVELWEQGRGSLIGQALDTRVDLTAVADQYPQLAADFIRLQEQLDSTTVSGSRASAAAHVAGQTEPGGGGFDSGGGDEIERRRKLAENVDKIVAEIRSRPGLERFLLPIPVDDLLSAAAEGPVVLINVTSIRSDALILTSGGVRVVALPAVSPQSVHEHGVAYAEALVGVLKLHERDRAEQELSQILVWLWDTIAGPVLEELGLTARPQDAPGVRWPRLWWVPSGLLSFLPIHAAGHHETRFDLVPVTVLDRVVSSYTPTVRALIHARRRYATTTTGPTTTGGGRLLVVTMPHTPAHPDLPGTVEEAALLRELFPDRIVQLHGNLQAAEAARLGLSEDGPTAADATRERVAAALTDCRWAHFACHATSDPTNPSTSHLLLIDQPLTVLDLIRLRLDDAELAFLSACATARTAPRLADEAIQLASALQLAGYRHVIATLWAIDDRNAVRTATDVYTALAVEGASAAAQALHLAIRRRRNLNPDRPSIWGAHIHSGA
jgi:hypothetical protein